MQIKKKIICEISTVPVTIYFNVFEGISKRGNWQNNGRLPIKKETENCKLCDVIRIVKRDIFRELIY